MSCSVIRVASFRFLLLFTAGALLATACTAASESSDVGTADSFVGADGVTSDTSDTSRIVTLSGDLTEFIFELGAGDSVVATDLTTVFPDAAVSLPKIGIGRFLSTEAVLKHNPSLVIGDTQTSPQSAIDQIRAAGVPVIILDVSTSFETMYAKVADLGVILGVQEAAESLVDTLERRIEEAGADLPYARDSLSVAYVYTRGPDVMLLFGSGMVTNPVIKGSGARDAGVASGVQGSIPVTPEALIAAAPDVLVVPEVGLDALGGIEGLLAIPGIAETPAGLSGWVLAYPEGDFLTLGPRIPESVARLVDDLAALVGTP